MFRAWGFRSGRDYFVTVLGLKATVLVPSQGALAVFGTGLAFWGTWVWEPPGAAFLILAMDLVNAFYGYRANKRIRGESFSWLKFQKTWAIMVTDLFGFAMLHIAIKYYPYYSLAGDALFGYYFAYKMGQIFEHWAALKLQNGTFATYFRSYLLKLLQSKLGADLVDSIQSRPAGEEVAPVLLPPPTETPPPGDPAP